MSSESSEEDTPRARLANDITRCELCISLAARAGVRIPQEKVRAVKIARIAFEANKMTPEIEASFYDAMADVVARSPYPSRTIADDLAHCSDVVTHAGLCGKPLDRDDVKALAEARDAQRNFDWNATVEAPFYDAMSRVTHAVAPVVAETVGADARKGARLAIRNYSWSALGLTCLLLALSCLMFVVREISDDMHVQIEKNDPIALNLHNQLQAYAAALNRANISATSKGDSSGNELEQIQNSPEAVAIKDTLQTFASNNRQLYSDIERARSASHLFFWLPNSVGDRLYKFFGYDWGEPWGAVASQYAKKCDTPTVSSLPNENTALLSGITFGFHMESSTAGGDWECTVDSRRRALEIDLPLFNIGLTADQKHHMIPDDTVNQGFQKIATYQQIRATANYARENFLTFVGMTTGFILPIFYAWLGAIAAILRKLRDDTATCLFHPEYSKVANRAHVTTAVIVGISIGLFSDLVKGGTEFSPLAMAFVAGYASDRFFEFIDRLVQTLFPSDRTQVFQPPEPKRNTPPPAGLAPRPNRG